MTAPVFVTVVDTQGSVPREIGASMTITPQGQDGTIGGGALEWEAAQIARDRLNGEGLPFQRTFPLGPSLGQCCGGAVTLQFSAVPATSAPQKDPVWIWGAGHVGRAVVSTLSPLQDRDITWIDTSAERFPSSIPPPVSPLVAAEIDRAVPHAPERAHHFIMTYSHDLDLRLCDALLTHGFATCGLIGSATKWIRFRKRLAQMGHMADQIARITCPIGDPALGKHPQAIAISVAAEVLKQPAPCTGAGGPTDQ